MASCRYSWVLLVITGVLADTTLFPSGDDLAIVEPSKEVGSEDFEDPENTGSLLYNATGVEEKRVGKNIRVTSYKSGRSQLFRAHPGFMKCAQEVIFSLKRKGIKVDVASGYLVASEADPASLTDRYLRTGCGIQLQPRDRDTGTLLEIAAAVLHLCPAIVEGYQRDLGLVLMADRVHFHMSGPLSTGPLIQIDGFSGDVTESNVMDWALTEINRGLDPAITASCGKYDSLAVGEQYPAGSDIDNVVGGLYAQITREMDTDFNRLAQYQGTSIEFADEEHNSDWCGRPGRVCPDCSAWIQGNTPDNRCADRVMSYRLLEVLNKLQQQVRQDADLSTKLLVLEAWDEPHSGTADSDRTSDLLHWEGRAVLLQLVQGNTAANLGTVAKYAICVGADYVEHRDTALFIAVKMMAGRTYAENNKRLFPRLELLDVLPPSSMQEEIELPGEFTDTDAAEYPLFYGGGRENERLAEGVTFGMFMSEFSPFFRLHPGLVDCYTAVVHKENKYKNDTAPTIVVDVVTGFLTNSENRFAVRDKRSNSHTLGVGMELRYRDDLEGYTASRLLFTVVEKCAPIFYLADKEMGVGLYRDTVFVDLRDKFTFFSNTDGVIPPGFTFQTFEEAMEERFIAAKNNKIVDPINLADACKKASPPKPQSCSFQHEHSEFIKQRRRRRQTSSEQCEPSRQTSFCQSTAGHRQAVVKSIMEKYIDRKLLSQCKVRDEMEATVRGCLEDCGTCLQGHVFEDKTEHCNNLLHWLDWTLENSRPDVTNFYVRRNSKAERHVCENGQECIRRAPLFAMLAPYVEQIYRPDPERSEEELLYSFADNPSPVFRLLEDIYAAEASGIVKFWVYDDKDMTALKGPLEVVMLYNRKVTLIKIYVDRYDISKEAVTSVVETAAAGMVTIGCPDVTRDALTPYVILEIPHDVRKRAAAPEPLGYRIRKEYNDFEARWLADSIRL